MHAQVCLNVCVYVRMLADSKKHQSFHVPAFTPYGDITGEGMQCLLFLSQHPIALLLGISFYNRLSSGLCGVMCLVEEQPARGCF